MTLAMTIRSPVLRVRTSMDNLRLGGLRYQDAQTGDSRTRNPVTQSKESWVTGFLASVVYLLLWSRSATPPATAPVVVAAPSVVHRRSAGVGRADVVVAVGGRAGVAVGGRSGVVAAAGRGVVVTLRHARTRPAVRVRPTPARLSGG